MFALHIQKNNNKKKKQHNNFRRLKNGRDILTMVNAFLFHCRIFNRQIHILHNIFLVAFLYVCTYSYLFYYC